MDTSSGRGRSVKDYKTARFKVMAGGHGTGRNEFNIGAYVTSSEDRCIVSDTHDHRIKIYDNSLNLIRIFGERGQHEDQLDNPRHLCTGRDGQLFLSDSDNNRIMVYDRDNKLIHKIGSKGTGRFDNPRGLALTSGKTELVVCDSNKYRLQVLTPEGVYIRSIGRRGDRPGEFKVMPDHVAVTTDGRVLVSEWRGSSLHVFSLSGHYSHDITPDVPISERNIEIYGFTVDRDDNILIADGQNHRLIVLDAGGDFICTIGSEGDQAGEMDKPWSVAVNDNREIVVYEYGNSRVQVFHV